MSPRRPRQRPRRLSLESLEDRRVLATFMVTSVDDAGEGTLRRAVDQANAQPGNDTILFDSALDGLTISLSTGEIGITQVATIDASSLTSGITIDASASDATPGVGDGQGSRIFNIGNDADPDFFVELRGLTITGGDVTGSGGAILSSEVLRVFDSTIRDSHATETGGGISANRLLNINGSTISGNSAGGDGGGISAYAQGFPVRLADTEVLENESGGRGGGMFADMPGTIGITNFEIANSLFAGNYSQMDGGGLHLNSLDLVETVITDSEFVINESGANGGGFSLDSGSASVDMIGGRFAGNLASLNGGGAHFGGYDGRIHLDGVTVSGNSAMMGGGGINSQDALIIDASEIVNNVAGLNGGGLRSVSNNFGQSTVSATTISGNTAHSGAGVFGATYSGSLSIYDSTISANRAVGGGTEIAQGGGVRIDATGAVTRISNSTISGNQSNGDAGGLFVSGEYSFNESTYFRLEHSTIANNTAEYGHATSTGLTGGAVIQYSPDDGSTATWPVAYSIFADNSNADGASVDLESENVTVAGSLVELAGSQVFPSGSDGNLVETDPLLGPLQDNGGPAETHALLTDSPAIDFGPLMDALDAPTTDGRGEGFARFRDGDELGGNQLDIGAYEVQGSNVEPIANAGDDASIRVTLPTTLDASQSNDPDEGPVALTYAWQVISGPGQAELSDPTAVTTQFTADTAGSYDVELTVSDGAAEATDTVTITVAENQLPIADATLSETDGEVDTVVILDGSLSSDPESDPLTYAWSLLEQPETSTATVSNADSDVASFLPDVNGTYVAQLIVSDGFDSSEPTMVTVEVIKPNDNPWHNILLTTDVNADGFVAPLDALLIINELTNRAFSDPMTAEITVTEPPAGAGFLDVTNDSRIAVLDALFVINDLNDDSSDNLPSNAAPMANHDHPLAPVTSIASINFDAAFSELEEDEETRPDFTMALFQSSASNANP